MPRQPRFILPGQPHHVIVRGVNREPIFHNQYDYRYYLTHLRQAIERHGCLIHAYVLMTNHTHLLITPSREMSIGKSMQSLGRYYVRYFNDNYSRTGTLWEGRYKSTLIDSEQYLLTCYLYIELNPLRANMVTLPSNYPWSSYRCNAAGLNDPVVTAHPKYNELGLTKAARQRAYRELFKRDIGEIKLNEIRHATNREEILGSDDFKASIAQKLQRRTKPLPRGGDRKSTRYRSSQQNINRH